MTMPCTSHIKTFFNTFMDVISESAALLFLRFRVEPVPSADRGRVQCCEKLPRESFFRAGNVQTCFSRGTEKDLY